MGSDKVVDGILPADGTDEEAFVDEDTKEGFSDSIIA
jgi:hypothetical protein